MMAPIDLSGAGRPEHEWRSWSAPRTWPPPNLPTGGRAVVVSAHPDDDVLGVGGLLRLLHDAGVDLVAVLASDGEASHPNSPTTTPQQLATRRLREVAGAYRALGIDPAVHRAGLPDGRIAEHEDHLARLVESVADPDDLVLAPWPHDGHPDHDAVGRAAGRAAARLAARIWTFPVWAWHWADPETLHARWAEPRRVDLPADVRAAKGRAVDAHASQVRPLSSAAGDEAILPPPVRERLARSWEVVLT